MIRAQQRRKEEKNMTYRGAICRYRNTSKHRLQQLERLAVNRRLWQTGAGRSSVSVQTCKSMQESEVKTLQTLLYFGGMTTSTSIYKNNMEPHQGEKAPPPPKIHLEYRQSASNSSFLSILTKIKATTPFFSLHFHPNDSNMFS